MTTLLHHAKTISAKLIDMEEHARVDKE